MSYFTYPVRQIPTAGLEEPLPVTLPWVLSVTTEDIPVVLEGHSPRQV